MRFPGHGQGEELVRLLLGVRRLAGAQIGDPQAAHLLPGIAEHGRDRRVDVQYFPGDGVVDEDAVGGGGENGPVVGLGIGDGLTRPFLFGDVAGDGRAGHDLAVGVLDRAHGERDVEAGTVLAQPDGLEMVDPAALAQGLVDDFQLSPELGRHDQVDHLADRFLGGVSVELFRTLVPAYDQAVDAFEQDGVVRGFDDGFVKRPGHGRAGGGGRRGGVFFLHVNPRAVCSPGARRTQRPYDAGYLRSSR